MSNKTYLQYSNLTRLGKVYVSRDCNLREVDLAVPVSVQLIQHDVKLVFCKRHFRSLKIDGFYLRSTIQFKRRDQTSNLYNWISWPPRVAKSTIENKTHAALKPSQHCTIYWLMVFLCFLFCLGFFVPFENFSLIWRRHHYR